MTLTDREVEAMQRVLQPVWRREDAAQRRVAPWVNERILGAENKDQPDRRDLPVATR